MTQLTPKQVKQLIAERNQLLEVNARLQALLQKDNLLPAENPNIIQASKSPSLSPKSRLSVDEKIVLFRSLFRGRDDIYAKRWEGKDGKVSYSPACINHWTKCQCIKPKIQCRICNKRELLPLTNQVIYDHLAGKIMAGVYPLLTDESCKFLAVDFDKANWHDDTAAFLKVCANLNIPAALERSQSGNGAHIWIFFETSILASLARKLGCGLLTLTMHQRHQLSLESYDRLFPNQDTMPKGGFGNLIAFPLQGKRRQQGNSIFIDEHFNPHFDQWEFLSHVRKMTYQDVDKLVAQFIQNNQIIDIHMTSDNEENATPWEKRPSNASGKLTLTEPLPTTIQITVANLVYIPKAELPSAILNRLKKLAAFQNPEFYRSQVLRLSTYDKS